MQAVKCDYAEELVDCKVRQLTETILPTLLGLGKEERQETIEKLFKSLNSVLEKYDKHPLKYQPDTFLLEDSTEVQYVFKEELFH